MLDLRKTLISKYHLWLTWKKLEKQGDGIIVLKSPFFEGPVLSDCEPIESNGNIILDFTDQYLLHLSTPYEIELSWGKVKSQDSTKAILDKAVLKDNNLGKISKVIENSGYILINCQGHHTDDINKGRFKRTFKSMIYKANKELYSL